MALKTATEEVISKRKLHGAQNKTESSGNKQNNDEIDYDDLLSSVGEFGPYQVMLFFSMFPFHVFGVFAYFSQLFMTEVSPDHWCWIPELKNLTSIERRSLAIPLDADSRFGYAQCQAYVANWSEVLVNGGKSNHSWSTTSCQHGWEFNGTEIPYPTISSELGWVCDKDSYQAAAQAISFFGSVIGGVLMGWMADRFGRLPAAVVSNVIGCIGGVASTFSSTFVEFAVSRFFLGMACDSCVMMVYLLVLEYVVPKYRSVISNVSYAVFYGLAVTTLPWIALTCGHWKTIGLVTSLPLALALLSPLLLPESPRWLLSKGRIDDAIQKILTIGVINKKDVPTKLIEQFKLSMSKRKDEKAETVLDLLKRPLLRRMFIILCLEFMFCTIIFDALVRSIGQLEFNFFVSFSVVSFTECPSLLIIAFIMDWMGRRWLTTLVMGVGCIFCILTVSIGGGLPAVMCAVVARFAVNMALGTVTQWTAEILPTSVRGSGISIIHICGYLATILSPYIVYLDTYINGLPLIVMGCVAGFGAVIALALPETAQKDLPQEFDDAEELVKMQKFCEMSCISRKTIEKNGHVNNGFDA